jgi:hypothetical protein
MVATRSFSMKVFYGGKRHVLRFERCKDGDVRLGTLCVSLHKAECRYAHQEGTEDLDGGAGAGTGAGVGYEPRKCEDPNCCIEIGSFNTLDVSVALTGSLKHHKNMGKDLKIGFQEVEGRMAVVFTAIRPFRMFVCIDATEEEAFAEHVGVIGAFKEVFAGCLNRKDFKQSFGVVSAETFSVLSFVRA